MEPDEIRNELNRLSDQLSERDAELEAVHSELNITYAKLDALQAELNNIRTQFNAVQAELQHVYASRSYRITAPMRAVIGWMRVWRDRMNSRNLHSDSAMVNNNGLSLDVNNLSQKEQKIYADLLKAVEQKKAWR